MCPPATKPQPSSRGPMQTEIETSPTTTEEGQAHTKRWVSPVLLIGLVAFLAGLLLFGILPRRANAKQLKEFASARLPIVSVAIATAGDATAELVLPSSVEASQEAPLYPRVSGYVKRIVADIGA